jgi:hypothetical protein
MKKKGVRGLAGLVAGDALIDLGGVEVDNPALEAADVPYSAAPAHPRWVERQEGTVRPPVASA